MPALVDTKTGKVVMNDYHVMSLELETAWSQFHKAGAPDLCAARSMCSTSSCSTM